MREDHNADSNREQLGLKSPYGRRGSICSHFGWTYDYLLHDIGWPTVQKMLIDASRFETHNPEDVKLTSNEEIANYINNLM